MPEPQIAGNARSEMCACNNCCRAVVLAAAQEWNLPVGEETLAATTLFPQGMSSGCTCGALVGLLMASGLRHAREPHPLGPEKLAQALHDRFRREFGATCCRVIRKKQNLLERLGNRACVDLAGRAALILAEVWEGAESGQAPQRIGHHSDPE